MKYKQVLAVALLCILLTSAILIGALAFSRVSRAYNYAMQFAGLAKGGVGSSTNLSLTMYSDPEPARPTLDLFRYVTAENIEWRGASMDPQGNAINIDVSLESVEFEKLDEDNYSGAVEGLYIHVAVGDLIYILVRADEVNVNMTFWTYMDMFPALNATGVLTGDVEVSLFVAVLPIPGLAQAVYEYKGDRFIISWCIIKPMDVTIEKPSDGDRVSGDVKIQALVKAIPEISVEHAEWWTEGESHFKGPMEFNETSGLWEGIWPSYKGGNGWYELNVGAEGVERKPGVEEFRYPVEDRIKVEVENPPFEVHTYLETAPDNFEEIPVEMEWWYREEYGREVTPFALERRVGYGLKAPEGWDAPPYGAMHFKRWIIRDEVGNPIFEHGDPNLEVNEEILGMLWISEEAAGQLECIYEPVH